MTFQEVAHILQDPHSVPDSDDEEDDRERKVKCRLVAVQALLVCTAVDQHWTK